MRRRRFLTALGTAALAGCAGVGGEPDGARETATGTATWTPTEFWTPSPTPAPTPTPEPTPTATPVPLIEVPPAELVLAIEQFPDGWGRTDERSARGSYAVTFVGPDSERRVRSGATVFGSVDAAASRLRLIIESIRGEGFATSNPSIGDRSVRYREAETLVVIHFREGNALGEVVCERCGRGDAVEWARSMHRAFRRARSGGT